MTTTRQSLTFREPDRQDLAFLTDLFARPETVAHRPRPDPDSPGLSALRLERELAHWADHGFGRWAVASGGRPIGFGGLNVTRVEGELNISYHIHPEAWGHGHATCIARHAVAHGFGPLAARCIRGLVREANPASRRVLEKLGFRFAGRVMLNGAPTMRFELHP